MKKAIILLFMLGGLSCFAEDSKPVQKLTNAQTLAIRKIIKDHLIDRERCYTDLIIENMEAHGTVVVSWKVDEKGEVQDIEVKKNTSNQAALGGCVTEKLPTWGFPAAEAGKVYNFEYSFKFGN